MHLICKTEDVPEREARGFETPVGDILITQRDGSFYAYKNLCPHLQMNFGLTIAQLQNGDRPAESSLTADNDW